MLRKRQRRRRQSGDWRSQGRLRSEVTRRKIGGLKRRFCGTSWRLGDALVHSIVEMDDAVGKLFGREQRELDVAMARRDERDAFADEDRDYVDAELVDFADVEEGSGDFAAAHHPDVFARLRAQFLRKLLDGLFDELDARLD